ncbi:Cas10/Cmr2 second palm domain-containing protein [Halonatronum saccharophilum]|uniref:Cas10/Cmr2 second palm domain-containing protein n=1 Tax=Halonatronum saccharophilum TaxID=150060 RepID=UPI0004851325|nr:type III-B CRISPR-associated protein Cas10/Cmr2 [Halonatronum saccharophilum]
MKQNVVILFAVSPVQTYIYQSRKVKDLFNSSAIIKKIVSIAKIKLKINDEADLILPKIKNDNVNSSPNYFIFEKEENDFKDIDDKKLKDDILNELVNKVEEKVVKENKKLILSHLKDQFRIYLVSEEISSEDNYKQAYDNLFIKLEDKKRGEFEIVLEELGDKCTLCGIRNWNFINEENNSIGKRCYLKKKLKKEKYNQIEEDKETYKWIIDKLEVIKCSNLDEKEALCASCYFKRFFGNKKNSQAEEYNSTAYYALYDILKKKQLLGLWKDFIESKEERYKSKDISIFKEYFKSSNNDDKEEYKYLLNLTQYCLVKVDIDNLGKKFKSLKSDEKLKEQEKLSAKLVEFNKEVVADCKLRSNDKNIKNIVYAGGDDILFLTTPNNLKKHLNKIKKKFKDIIIKEFSDLSYSTSIVIAHYKSDLAHNLKILDSNLELVKERYKDKGKAGMIVTWKNSSSLIKTTYFKNDFLEHFFGIRDYFNKSEKSFYISPSFINSYQEIINNLGGDDYAPEEFSFGFMRIFVGQLERILKRKIITNPNNNLKDNREKNKKNKEKFIEEAKGKLEKFLKINLDRSNAKVDIDFDNYFNILYIANQLANLSTELNGSDNNE